MALPLIGSFINEYLRVLSLLVYLLILTCILFIFICALSRILLPPLLRWNSRQRHPHIFSAPQSDQESEQPRPLVVGFFHPYCNAGGGGERVLWCAIRALQRKYPTVQCVVYTGDTDSTSDEIIQHARDQFSIILPRPVHMIFLQKRNWVEAQKYPYFTLLGQSLGSILLGVEALCNIVPDVYIDSMGYAFTLPLFKYFGGCKVGCYVHYPTISTDMLERVSERTAAHNNTRFISDSTILSNAKIIYYHIFAFLYGCAGRVSSVIMVNSSWTSGHILHLWRAFDRTHTVYPPCNVQSFLEKPLEPFKKDGSRIILSVAQFRPEKDHALQINSFADFISKQPVFERHLYKLVLVGSIRNADDSARVDELKKLSTDLDLEAFVEFQLNISFTELKSLFSQATIGLHTMWNEHFGIGVVELMASGAIVLAHDSGGPKMDIVTDYEGSRTGYLADSIETYSSGMETIFSLSSEEQMKIRQSARHSVTRFSDEVFEEGFLSAIESLCINNTDNQ